MATVTTTAQSALFAPPIPLLSREMANINSGRLYALVRTATSTLTVYWSTNNGGSWSSHGAFTHTGIQEWSSLALDGAGYAHLVYRVSDGSADTIYHRRFNLALGTWSAATQASAVDANGGVAGSRWQGVECSAYRLANGDSYVPWVGGYSNGGGQQGAAMGCLLVKANGATSQNHNTVVNGNRFWLSFTSGRQGPAMEIEHNGNGQTPGTNPPNLWITFGRTKLLMVKMAWNGNGWNGVSYATQIRASVPAMDRVAGRWDGTRWMMTVVNPDDTTTVLVYQRNQANTSTSTITTPAHPQGVVRQMALSYNATTKDLRVYAVGTSNDTLYRVDYNRGTATWGSWTQVSATAIISGSQWTVRRGGTTGNGNHDLLLTHTTPTPNTVLHVAQSAGVAPAVSTFDTSGKPYVNGGAADVGAALALSWTFSDPDVNETQGSYALSRQIGAGAVQYWNAGSSTWGGSEVQNVSSTQGVTLASGWGADSDANHQYKVKVWDSSGVPATAYSDALTLIPSAVVNPAITAPAAAAVITASRVTVTWTAAQQTGARVVLTETSPGSAVRYDSGPMMGYTDTSFEIPYEMPTGSAWTVTLYTYNNEGLVSTGQNRSFTVAYAPPPAPLSTFVASTAAGTITVTPAPLAPAGTQPAIVGGQLYRRPVRFAEQLANGSISSTTGWAGVDGTMTLSGAQARDGANSLRLVPNGSGAQPRVQTTAAAAVVDSGLVSTPWVATGWIRPDTANKPIIIGLVYFDAGGTELGTVLATFTTVVAAAWHYVSVTGNAEAYPTAARVGVRIGLGSTPAAGDAFYADLLSLRPYDSEEGVRLLDELGTPAAYADWGAASGVEYEYQWRVQGNNDTTQVGPWVS